MADGKEDEVEILKNEVSPNQTGLEEKLPSEKFSLIWAFEVLSITSQKNSSADAFIK